AKRYRRAVLDSRYWIATAYLICLLIVLINCFLQFGILDIPVNTIKDRGFPFQINICDYLTNQTLPQSIKSSLYPSDLATSNVVHKVYMYLPVLALPYSQIHLSSPKRSNISQTLAHPILRKKCGHPKLDPLRIRNRIT